MLTPFSRSTGCLMVITPMLVALGLSTRSASAQVWTDVNQLDGKLPSWVDEKYVRPMPPMPPTRDEVQYRRIWVEPCYQIIRKRVWVEPIIRVVYEQVWVQPRYEIRETVTWEGNVQVIRRERICVEPGGYKTVRREIVESPGCWKWIETRDLVSGGFWRMEPM